MIKQAYTLLFSLSCCAYPTLAQSTKTVAERDSISPEVTVVSNKVRQIDNTDPIFTPIPLTTPQVVRYDPPTPRSTGDFTPVLAPAATPQLAGYASEVPRPYNGVMARIFGGYTQALGGDLAGKWHVGNEQNVLSFDLTHRSELFTLSKISPFLSGHGPVRKEDADYHYLEELPTETNMYRHATAGALSYSYHWRESAIKLQAGLRNHIFAHRPVQQVMQLTLLPQLDRTKWQTNLREYNLTGRIDNLVLNNWIFDLGAHYSFVTHSLPSPSTSELIATEQAHILNLDGSTTVRLSDDWSLALMADAHLRMGRPKEARASIIGAHPQFRYRGFVGFADLDLSGGLGLNVSTSDLALYPELRLSLTDQKRWQWYLQTSGGLRDVDVYDYLVRIPGIMLNALPKLERQQLISRTGIKLHLGSGTYELYGGYNRYTRTNGFHLIPYSSWLVSQRNYYAPLNTFYLGLNLTTSFAKVCVLSFGAQFNRHDEQTDGVGHSIFIDKPEFESYVKLALHPTRRLDLRGVLHFNLGPYTKMLYPVSGKDGLHEGATIGSFSRFVTEVIAQYRLTDAWTLFASFDRQSYELGAYKMKQPYSGRIGVQFNWSAL